MGESSVANPSPSASSLLVVEDDPVIREQLAEGLTDAGFAVSSARDGVEAVQQMLAARPDLVLLDLMMPRMTGWQLMQEMKEQPELRDVAVVVITAARYVGSVPQGVPCWVKPLRLDRLTKSIRAFLG
jgi:CheY-like chemotaxis protein